MRRALSGWRATSRGRGGGSVPSLARRPLNPSRSTRRLGTITPRHGVIVRDVVEGPARRNAPPGCVPSGTNGARGSAATPRQLRPRHRACGGRGFPVRVAALSVPNRLGRCAGRIDVAAVRPPADDQVRRRATGDGALQPPAPATVGRHRARQAHRGSRSDRAAIVARGRAGLAAAVDGKRRQALDASFLGPPRRPQSPRCRVPRARQAVSRNRTPVGLASPAARADCSGSRGRRRRQAPRSSRAPRRLSPRARGFHSGRHRGPRESRRARVRADARERCTREFVPPGRAAARRRSTGYPRAPNAAEHHCSRRPPLARVTHVASIYIIA